MKTSNLNYNSTVFPVLLCGGSGSRLWPISRESYPKQFVKFFNQKSSFQTSLLRSLAIAGRDLKISRPVIVTNNTYRFLVKQQAREVCNLKLDYILESDSKNTAPSLTLAALHCYEQNKNSVMVVSSSDHFIQNSKTYVSKIKKAIKLATSNNIVLLGIKPLFPSQNFGYIGCEKPSVNDSFFNVLSFNEKPSQRKAVDFLSKGNFLWNAGIFIIKASVWLEAISFFDNKLYNLCTKSFQKREIEDDYIRPNQEFFKKIKSNSIDYAVLQKFKNTKFSLKAVELNTSWHDLGTWESFWSLYKNNSSNNLIFGDVVENKISNSVIYSSSRMVVANNVDDIVLIETPDLVMLRKKSDLNSQNEILNLLKKHQRLELNLNRKEYRPWGWFDILEQGDGYKVKRILIEPKSSISLQMHMKRSEHWIVINGQLNVISGNKKFTLKKNESFFIPKNTKHRLFNDQKNPAEVIEVQTGDYLEEDDIIRFEDKYKR
jgi:mannose-1-phosphate guanylyltransferase/mannose-6-phosphate isomerase